MGKPVLEILSLKVCSGYTFKKHDNCKETYCKSDKSKYSSYKVHIGCQKYKGLSKKIQHLYPNLQLEEKKISEEAKAV